MGSPRHRRTDLPEVTKRGSPGVFTAVVVYKGFCKQILEAAWAGVFYLCQHNYCQMVIMLSWLEFVVHVFLYSVSPQSTRFFCLDRQLVNQYDSLD